VWHLVHDESLGVDTWKLVWLVPVLWHDGHAVLFEAIVARTSVLLLA
jgi:hypothetical protein